MKARLLDAAVALALLGVASPASADIIDVTFSGAVKIPFNLLNATFFTLTGQSVPYSLYDHICHQYRLWIVTDIADRHEIC
jgi:hypothetical protein